jgi:hypothetical protein
MKLQIEQAHIEAMMAAFPGSTRCANSSASGIGWRSFHTLEAPELDLLETLYRAGDAEDRAKAAQPRAGRRRALRARRAGDGRAAIARYLAEDASRGWLFSAGINGKPPPGWSRGWISPASKRERQGLRRAQGQLRARLAATTLRITGPTSPGAPWPSLGRQGLRQGTPALLASYDEMAARYFDWRGRTAQFSGTGRLVCREPHRHHRDTDWSRKDQVILSSTGRPRGW